MIDIFSWIDKNIEKKLTVDDIVRISGYSRRHLHNIFIRYSNKSVAEYIRLKKLKVASIFLKLTNLTVIEIAERFNFDSPQTFSQVFKKYYLMSPLDYRRSAQWGKAIYFTDPSKFKNISFDFVRKEHEEFFGKKYIFHLNVSEGNKYWSSTQKKVDQLRIESLLRKKDNVIRAAIAHFPCVNRKNYLNVEYIHEEESNKKGVQRIVISAGDYLKATKVGTLNDFHGVSNTLYRDVLYPFNLKKREGYDYEEITKLDSGILEYSFYIPVNMP